MDEIVVTLDFDWAPDFTIDFAAEKLLALGVRATWFVTHTSPAVERLRQNPELFELGIHPNFLPNSSHGDTPDKVLKHCMMLVPEATSVRTHSLFQSTPLLNQILGQTTLTRDASLFLPHTPYLRPVEYHWRGRTLLRIPTFWEDDIEMERREPCWSLGQLLAVGEGLKVFNFHPIHIFLNSVEMKPYQALKHCVERISEAKRYEASTFIRSGIGTQTLFIEVIKHLANRRQSFCVRDISVGGAGCQELNQLRQACSG